MINITTTYPKARKQHKCELCLLPIEQGEKYERQQNEHEGELYVFKSHISCMKLASDLGAFESCSEGIDSEIFRNAIWDFINDDKHFPDLLRLSKSIIKPSGKGEPMTKEQKIRAALEQGKKVYADCGIFTSPVVEIKGKLWIELDTHVKAPFSQASGLYVLEPIEKYDPGKPRDAQKSPEHLWEEVVRNIKQKCLSMIEQIYHGDDDLITTTYYSIIDSIDNIKFQDIAPEELKSKDKWPA